MLVCILKWVLKKLSVQNQEKNAERRLVTSERRGNACECHRVSSPVAMQGLRCGACGQERLLPTNATAVELMRNFFLETVKLRVHVALRQHARRVFLTGRYRAGPPLLLLHYSSLFTATPLLGFLSRRTSVAATLARYLVWSNVRMCLCQMKFQVFEGFFLETLGGSCRGQQLRRGKTKKNIKNRPCGTAKGKGETGGDQTAEIVE